MKLIELYKKAVELGIKEDPRSVREIKHYFEEVNRDILLEIIQRN